MNWSEHVLAIIGGIGAIIAAAFGIYYMIRRKLNK